LLLSGFLSGKLDIGAEDVNVVVNELAHEGTMGTPSTRGDFPSGPMPLDVDVSRLSLDSASADSISHHLGSLAELQQGDRLQRLERSLLRLEQINIDTLETLKKLVKAVRRPPEGGAS
jgi:general secretion pathway protein A